MDMAARTSSRDEVIGIARQASASNSRTSEGACALLGPAVSAAKLDEVWENQRK